MWKAIVAVLVVLVVAAGAFGASALKVFASPKAVVLSAIEKGNSKDGLVASTLELKLSNFKANVPGAEAVNNVPLKLGFSLDQTNRRMQLHFETEYKQKAAAGDLFVDENGQMILALSPFQSILDEVVKEVLKATQPEIPAEALQFFKVPPLPQYITFSKEDLGGAMDIFWKELDKSKGDSAKVEEAGRKAAALLIKAIPDQYFARDGLTTVRISFSQKDLVPMLKGVLQYAVDHKDEVADALAEVTAATQSQQVSKDDVRKMVLDGISKMPVNQVVSELEKSLNQSKEVELGQTTITIKKPVFGDTSMTVEGSITFNGKMGGPQPGNVSGTLDYKASMETKKGESITLPKLDAKNSKPFKQFLGSLGF